MQPEYLTLATQEQLVTEQETALTSQRNREAEYSVLGAILLFNETLADVEQHLSPEHFYWHRHQIIYQMMLELDQKQEPIDVITLYQYGLDTEQYNADDGKKYLFLMTELADNIPVISNVGYYVKIVREKADIRAIVKASHETIAEAKAVEDVEAFIDAAEQRILDVRDDRAVGAVYDCKSLVRDAFLTIEDLWNKQKSGELQNITGTPTGLQDFDNHTAGLQRKDLIILAGRPSMGKTALVTGVAVNAAASGEGAVTIFSLEMSKEQLMMRLLSNIARVDSERVRKGRLTEADIPKLTQAATYLASLPLYINDDSGCTIWDIRRMARKIRKKHGKLAAVIVDYLQLIIPEKELQREQEIAVMSKGLKGLAKEQDCPVVALSQLNRSLERRPDKRPVMSDLRESGSIEQDADVICFIYRDEVYHEDTEDKGIAELIIAKQRNGPVGTVRTRFIRQFTRFENLEPENT